MAEILIQKLYDDKNGLKFNRWQRNYQNQTNNSNSSIVICFPTKHSGVLRTRFYKRVRVFRIELEFRSVAVLGKGKTGIHGEKPLGARAGSHW